MSLDVEFDLGEAEPLAIALGLMSRQPDGSLAFEADWLSNPGDHVKTMLSDEEQRDALEELIATLVGSFEPAFAEVADTVANWLPIAQMSDPDITVAVVFEPGPGGIVDIGIGVRLASATVGGALEAHVPLFRSGANNPVERMLLGGPDGTIRVAAELSVDTSTPPPGVAHLGAISLGAAVPTGGAPASLSVTLRDLQLPGANAPIDHVLSLSAAEPLDGQLGELLLGLLDAQANALGAGAITDLLSLLGLGPDGGDIPPFPLDDVLTGAHPALTNWFVSVVSSSTALDAWVGALASLFGGTAIGSSITIPLGSGPSPLMVSLDMAVETDDTGRPHLRPTLGVELVSGETTAAASAVVVDVDLVEGHVIAVPSVELVAELSANPRLLVPAGTPAIGVDALRVGLSLDENRRLQPVLAAVGVDIDSVHYDLLDLTDPRTVAGELLDLAGGALRAQLVALFGADFVDLVLEAVGVEGTHASIALLDFVADPLGTLRNHWSALLAHDTALAELFERIVQLVVPTVIVSGTGVVADPWRFGSPQGPTIIAWRDESNTEIWIGVAFDFEIPDIGVGNLNLASTIQITALHVDLANGSASVLPAIEAGCAITGTNDNPISVVVSQTTSLSTDQIELAIVWSSDHGIALEPRLSPIIITVEGNDFVCDLATLVDWATGQIAAGTDELTQLWDGLERLVVALVERFGGPMLQDLAQALGWGDDDSPCSLAALIEDPQQAMRGWLSALIEDNHEHVERFLDMLARGLTDLAGFRSELWGSGRYRDPWRFAFTESVPAPSPAVWTLPDGALPKLGLPSQLRNWNPGDAGLTAGDLIGAIRSEAAVAEDVADLLKGRLPVDLEAGVDALLRAWSRTDGVVAPAVALPSDVEQIVLGGVETAPYDTWLKLDRLLYAVPDVVIHVAISHNGSRPKGWNDVADDRFIDLTAAELNPFALSLPDAATGEWFVLLGSRALCRLPSHAPNDITGQSDRLAAVVAHLGVAGASALVGYASSGYVCRVVADLQTTVTQLVTAGTPWEGAADLVTSGLDQGATGEALRLLRAVVSVGDGALAGTAVDNSPLHDLVTYLIDHPVFGPLAEDFSVPTGLPASIRAGLAAATVDTVLHPDVIAQALSMGVLSGLAARARHRFDNAPALQGLGIGMFLGLAPDPGTDAIAVEATMRFDAATLTIGNDGLPDLTVNPRARSEVAVTRPGAWLVGAPGTTTDVQVRSVTVEVEVPVGPAADPAQSDVRVVLHDASIHGLSRARWEISVTSSPHAGVEITGALPEAQQMLAHVFDALGASSSARVAALLSGLDALGVLQDGSLNVDGLNELIHSPYATIAAALAMPASRDQLLDALAGFLGVAVPTIPGVLEWTRGPITVRLDLVAGVVSVHGASGPGEAGVFDWELAASLTLGLVPAVEASATIAADSALFGAVTLAGAANTATGTGSGVVGGTYRPPAGPELAYSLLPDIGGPNRTDLARLLPPLACQLLLDALLEADAHLDDIVGEVLELAGIIERDGEILVASVLELLNDPAGWLRSQLGDGTSVSTARLRELLDAAKTLLGVDGPSGGLNLGHGVTVAIVDDDGDPAIAVAASRANTAATTAHLEPEMSVMISLPAGAPPRLWMDTTLHAMAADGSEPFALSLGVDPQLNVGLTLGGTDVDLFPTTSGLMAILGSAAGLAVAMVLDEIVAASAPPAIATAGDVIARIGDALDLRTSGNFDSQKIGIFAQDPADHLVTNTSSLVAALAGLAPSLDTVLGALGTVSWDSGNPNVLEIGVSRLTATLDLSVPSLTVSAQIDDAPVGPVDLEFSVDQSGPTAAAVALGPLAIDVGSTAIHPFVRMRADAVGGSVVVGLADGADTSARVSGEPLDPTAGNPTAIYWAATIGEAMELRSIRDGSASGDADDLALAALSIAGEIALALIADIDKVQNWLDDTPDQPGRATIRELLTGVLLDDSDPGEIIDAPLDPTTALARVGRFGQNLATGGIFAIELPEGLEISLAASGSDLGIAITTNQRIEFPLGDLVLWIDVDADWIDDAPAPGLSLLFGSFTATGFAFDPSLIVGGLGLGIGRTGGKLIDEAVSLGAVTLHAYADVSRDAFGGGAQLGLVDLSVSMQGGKGNNAVAQGVMNDAQSGDKALAPTFSPRVSLQKAPGDTDFTVGLSLGPDSGPWWLLVQKSFGPVYVEQVGVGVVVDQRDLESISVYVDGSMSLFGLSASVNDLELRYVFGQGSFFSVDSWEVDLAGFAISADMAGLSLSGGLAKFEVGDDVEFIGSLMARFAVYGITVFGGYGTSGGDDPYSSFFAFGAINGPIGGPPAFFLTGIGGGFGINRQLVVPTDLSDFGSYPLIAALDPAATAPDDPMDALEAIRDAFPPQRGTIWFAAGISFTSFALVDGVAAVGVEIGDGLDISLLGLARLALPRPQVPLVSIELALLARFSTSEGVLWIQAQLTDNSWLLHESVRLTGGFAFVSWFKGDRKGQFVLTIGGYHPRFEADGYPVVPRLGFNWSVSNNIVIKGGGYFALTSEALMAGGELVASASFGPAWAEVTFAAHGIVYFDPFFFEVEIYARISAGVTINLLFTKATLKFSLGARLIVAGPKIFGTASFEVGPVSLSVSFGTNSPSRGAELGWTEFVAKYLEAGSSSSQGRVATGLPGKGAVPSGVAEGAGADDTAVADGSTERPFEVHAEFEFIVTTTVPIETLRDITAGDDDTVTAAATSGPALGLAPMGEASLDTELVIGLETDDQSPDLVVTIVNEGAFPVGVWGRPTSTDSPSVPTGDVIKAANGALVSAIARSLNRTPEMNANQVETGDRHPLPLLVQSGARTEVVSSSRPLVQSITQGIAAAALDSAAGRLDLARAWMAQGGVPATTIAALAGERTAPPLFASLGEDLFRGADEVSPGIAVEAPFAPVEEETELRPEVVALLRGGSSGRRLALSTVSNRNLARVATPSMAAAATSAAATTGARLLVQRPPALVSGSTVRPRVLPVTRSTNPTNSIVKQPGRSAPTALAGINDDLVSLGIELAAGTGLIIDLVGSRHDRSRRRPSIETSQDVRTVVLAAGGRVLADSNKPLTKLPRGAARVVLLNQGAESTASGVPAGWTSSQTLPYVGWQSLLAHDAVVRITGLKNRRRQPAWMAVADLLTVRARAVTRFRTSVNVVAVVLDGPGTDEIPDVVISLKADGPDGKKVDGKDLGVVKDPIIVSDGRQVTLVYDLGEVIDGATVSVDTGDRWRVEGTMGWRRPVDEIVEVLQRQSVDDLVVSPDGVGRQTRTARWIRGGSD